MNVEFFAAGAVGVGPAFLLMFYTLRRYEYPYVEKALFRNDRLFLSFAVGMVFGVISAVVLNYFTINLYTTAILVLFLVALFEESFKLVYLNLKLFQKEFDTVFYGSSTGLGMAATFVMAFAYQTFTSPFDPFSPVNVLVLITLSVAINSLHFFTGSTIGVGAASGRPWNAFFKAVASRGAFALLVAPFLAPAQVINPYALVAFLLAGTAFAIYLYRESYSSVIPDSLPLDVRRRLRRPAKERA